VVKVGGEKLWEVVGFEEELELGLDRIED